MFMSVQPWHTDRSWPVVLFRTWPIERLGILQGKKKQNSERKLPLSLNRIFVCFENVVELKIGLEFRTFAEVEEAVE